MRIVLIIFFSTSLFAQSPEKLKFALEHLQTDPEIPFFESRIHSPEILFELYQSRQFRPYWGDTDLREKALGILQGSEDDGLISSDYHVETIRIINDNTNLPEEVKQLYAELLVTDGLVLLNHHLLNGKVDPRDFDYAWNYPLRKDYLEDQGLDPAKLEGNGILRVLENNRPDIETYFMLKDARKHYVHLLRSQGEPEPLPYINAIRPGTAYANFGQLLNRLALLGYLPMNNYDYVDAYDSTWLDPMVRFQRLHGIDTDGIIGKKSFEKLNITIEERINSIDVNLERLRWSLGTVDDDFLVVNIAGFHLYLVEDYESEWDTPVMTGAIDTQTPIFTSHIKYLVFNPTWTVPRSIIEKSLFARIKADPQYLATHHYYLADRTGKKIDYGSIDWENMTVSKFNYYVVQSPGPHNALGRVKFMFPNKYSIYLHDTPSRSLFTRSSRAFSHGCIRVQHPLKLAEILLDSDQFDQESIADIIAKGETTSVSLPEPKKILLAYLTVFPSLDGHIIFYDDVYNRDAAVFEALKASE